jgi:hypothetical protein
MIEELMLHTKARCLVLDPNADFRRMHEVQPESLWDDAAYDARTRVGRLPHEASRNDFSQQWSTIPIAIRSNSLGNPPIYLPLRVPLASLSADFLSDPIHLNGQSGMIHCHSFLQALGPLIELKSVGDRKARDVLDTVEMLTEQAVANPQREEKLAALLELEYDVKSIIEGRSKLESVLSASGHEPSTLIPFYGDLLIQDAAHLELAIHDRKQIALRALKYLDRTSARHYFSQLRQYQAEGILEPSVGYDPNWLPRRLEIIDLPSIATRRSRLLALNAILAGEWSRLRAQWASALSQAPDHDRRVPLFIIADEAHNLMPKTPLSDLELRLRDQFRSIVAEGRKYGLFLIIVTQRPDKLDPWVLGECDNKALLKLSGPHVLTMARTLLGLNATPSRHLDRVSELDPGRVLLAGRWSPEPQVCLCAARRTVEGGRNLRPEYWANPMSSTLALAAVP